MAQCSDDDSPAGSLFSGDENPTAHCTDSPVLPPHIGLTSPPYQVAQQNDSAFLKDDSPLFSDDETHAAALSTSSPVRFPLMDLTNELGREFSKRDRSLDSEFSIRPTKRSKIVLKSTVALALSPPTNLLKKQPYVEITRMTNSRRQLYKKLGGEIKTNSLSPTQSSQAPKARHAQKASNEYRALALSQAPSWETLPTCSYDEPSHPHLPEDLTKLLEQCQEAPCSSTFHLCPVPGFFGLQWIDALQCLYCEMHTSLVSGEHIWPHVSRLHKGSWPNITRSSVLVAFLGHIQQCYPSVGGQSTADLKSTLPARLPLPLPLAPIILRYKCPMEGCNTWNAINKGKGADNSEHMRHVKTHSLSGAQYEAASQIEAQWTQGVQTGETRKKGEKVIVFVVPHDHDHKSCDPVFPISKPSVAARGTETWPAELGWDEELQRISSSLGVTKEGAVAKLKNLVELPSRDRVFKAESDVFKFVEQGLWNLNQLSLKYFTDAIHWIAGKHSSFRCLFGHDKKEPFYLPVHDHELYRIRRLHCAMETMIIRSLLESIVMKKPLSFLKCSEAAQNAGYVLVHSFITEKGNPNVEKLLMQKHILFIELLKGGTRTAVKVGEISEQALLALSLLPSGEWIKAAYVRRYVCGGLWSFRATFANWARSQGSQYLPLDPSLGSDGDGSSEVYSPYISTNHGDEVPDVLEQVDESDEDDNAAAEEELTSIEDLDYESMPQISSMQDQDLDALLLKISSAIDYCFADSEEENSFPVAVDKFVEAKQEYLQAKDAITPVGRLKMINSVLYKYATYKPAYSSSFHDGSFLISNGHDTPVSISVRGLRNCLLSSQRRLSTALQAVLPTSLDLEKLPFRSIDDDFSGVPLHLQPHNQKVLEPHLASCWTALLNGESGGKKLWGRWGLHRSEADKWLEACEHCFSLASAAIFLSTGGANFATLRHQQYSGKNRTIYLLDDGTMIFVNPLPSYRKSNSSLDLIAVTPELTQYLLILFLILLPISSDLRQLKGQIHPYAATHVWLMYHKRLNGTNNWLFDEKHMNVALEAVTTEEFGFPLNSQTLYQTAFGVFRKEFPAFFINIKQDFRSPVDDLAQHRYSTGIANYGRLAVFPKSPHLVGDQPWRHLAICQLWQAFLGCIPVKDMWAGSVVNSKSFSHINLPFDLAFRTARDQVIHFYGIIPLSSERRTLATSILQSAPYLKGITTISEFEEIGDRALSAVIEMLAFGPYVPEYDRIRNSSVTAEIVADAAILIMRALCEWVDVSYVDLSRPSSNMALRFEDLRKEILVKIKDMWKSSTSRPLYHFQQ